MKESTNPVSRLSAQQQTELELLHAILGQESPYPWNPHDPAAIAYLDQLEQAATADGWSEEAFESRWSQLQGVAAQLWATPSTSLMTVLSQKVGPRMPAQLLEQLAQQAQAAVDSGQSLIDQMVMAAQSVLSEWDPDDLQVMARPMALAMRGEADDLDAIAQSMPTTDWQQLSEVEQARLSLAIARYAIAELSADD